MALERKDGKRLAFGSPVPRGASPGAGREDPPEGDSIRISENVISSIVRKYTLEVEGVVRFATNSIVSGLAQMIGQKSQDSNIVVDLDGDSVTLSVNLVMAFGVNVSEVAAKVQEVTRLKVQEMTGKKVARVNVTVQDLDDPARPKDNGNGTEAN